MTASDSPESSSPSSTNSKKKLLTTTNSTSTSRKEKATASTTKKARHGSQNTTATRSQKNIDWVVQSQRGRTRSQFYWIALESEPGNKLRITADLEKDNHIKLTATREDKPTDEIKLRLYLDDTLVDLSKKIRITLNGKEQHNDLVKKSNQALIESTASQGDPNYIFPAMISVGK